MNEIVHKNGLQYSMAFIAKQHIPAGNRFTSKQKGISESRDMIRIFR